MVFTGLNILYYLLNRKTRSNDEPEQHENTHNIGVFIEIEKFKEGHYLVQERENSLRNFSFRVFELNALESIEKSLFFIKQVKTFNKVNLLEIDAEARALILLNDSDMKDFIPLLLDSDFYNGCIVMNHLDGDILQEYLVKHYRFIGFGIGIEDKWKNIFSIMSGILATLHLGSIKQNFPEYTPTVLQITEEFLNNISKIRELRSGFVTNQNLPSKKIMKYLQQILPLISNVDYNKDAIIHRDAHFQNFIHSNINDANRINLKLVDWELTSIGDKYWDIAKIYSSLLDLNTDSNKTTFINEVVKLIWDSYHKISEIKKENRDALKVVNFILYDSLERELNAMLDGKLLDENKIKELYESLKKPQNFSVNGISLYKILTTL